MNKLTHEEIAPLANALWEKQGRPDGKSDEHWSQAEAHLRFNRQADDNGAAHERFLQGPPPDQPQQIKHYLVAVLNQQPMIIDAVSVDETDPIRVRFTTANGSIRSYGRGLLLSYKECDELPGMTAGSTSTASA